MDKPIVIRRQEFIEELINLINGSGLPAFAVIDVLNDCSRNLQPLVEAQYMAALDNMQKESEE